MTGFAISKTKANLAGADSGKQSNKTKFCN